MRQLVQLGRRGSRKHRRERRTIPGGCRRDRPSWRRIAPTQAGSGGVRTAYRAHRGDLHRGRASFRRKLLVTGPRVRRDRVLWWSVEASARQPALLSARRRKAGTPGAQLGHKVEPITLCLNRQCRMIAAGCRQTRKPARGCSVRRHPADAAQRPDCRPRSARRLRGWRPDERRRGARPGAVRRLGTPVGRVGPVAEVSAPVPPVVVHPSDRPRSPAGLTLTPRPLRSKRSRPGDMSVDNLVMLWMNHVGVSQPSRWGTVVEAGGAGRRLVRRCPASAPATPAPVRGRRRTRVRPRAT